MDSTAAAVLVLGVMATVAAMAGPLAYPNAPIMVWKCLLGAGLIGMAMSILYLICVQINVPKIASLYIVSLGALLLAVGMIWYFLQERSSNPQIHLAYKNAYEKHRDKLGSPRSAPINSSPATELNKDQWQAWTDNATIIWMRVPGIMYAFDRDSGNRLIKTTDYAHADPNLFDEDYVRKRLKLKEPQYWPQGSLAYQLINNQGWKWIGNVLNQCKVDGTNIYYQEFERGIIYGPFRVTQKNADLSDAVVFIVFNNGSWVREVIDAEAPMIVRCLGPVL